jgi:hypothetical protein
MRRKANGLSKSAIDQLVQQQKTGDKWWWILEVGVRSHPRMWMLKFLSNWQWPQIQDLQSFQGPLLHSAAWNNNVDLTGKRVAVIGNGSSGIQLVTAIQPGTPR